ncbi:MAG: sulfatase [Balneolaceae bacterium]|nr:sulfatase [Balneolaceae bacterium]
MRYTPAALALYLIFGFCSSVGYSVQPTDEEKEPDGPPNIIFLMAEDISNDLETYGTKGVQTPNLNKLADQGVKYTNVFSTNPICSPNRSAIMVGAHQNMIGAQHHRSNRNKILPEPYKPITYWLRKAGYTNILGNELVRGNGGKIDVNFKHAAIGPYDGKDSFGLFDKRNRIDLDDQPFFAQIQLNVTHRGDWWKEVSEESEDPVDPEEVELPPFLADTPIIRQDWARYLDQIEAMDHEVGLIMAMLEEKGIADYTVVIFIGDNGRCNIRGKGYLYDSGLRVPMIIRWPGQLEGGHVNDQVISVTDISASILKIAGAELPGYLTGQPFILEESNREAVISARDLWDEVMERSRSVTTERYKYIRHDIPWVPYDAGQAYLEFYRPAVHVMRRLMHQGRLDSVQAAFFQPEKPKEEFYDLATDPHETRNLVGNLAYSTKIKALRDRLQAWERELPGTPIEEFNFTVPRAPAILQWIKYERNDLYQQMLNGKEIGFSRARQLYQNRN